MGSAVMKGTAERPLEGGGPWEQPSLPSRPRRRWWSQPGARRSSGSGRRRTLLPFLALFLLVVGLSLGTVAVRWLLPGMMSL